VALAQIDWDEYKEYKRYATKKDNFDILIDFMKSYYNIANPFDIYEYFCEDETASLMMQKRKISDAEGLENYIYKN
jgi:hypothetical protein